MSSGSLFRFSVMAATLFAWPALADSHTPEDVPQTFAEGFIQGVGVPVISLYHLAAMVGIGILVGIAAPTSSAPTTFRRTMRSWHSPR
jgi:urease accessory protein